MRDLAELFDVNAQVDNRESKLNPRIACRVYLYYDKYR
jgi:hypothetical protein